MINEFIKRLLSSIILIPIIFFIIIKGSYFFNLFLIICLMLTLFEWHNMTKNKKYNLIGNLLILFSFFTVFQLRNNEDGSSLPIFFLILFTCIFSDIGGYIFGKIFKGPKLIKISPNKTYAGVIGAYSTSMLMLIILFNYLNINFLGKIYLNKVELFLIFSLSTVSQLGDIIISYCKRLSNIKNTGSLIPGHGGILDRIDGMIFAFPFYYLIELLVKI